MVDAGGLNPPGAKALYRFESDPGHTKYLAIFKWSGVALWIGEFAERFTDTKRVAREPGCAHRPDA